MERSFLTNNSSLDRIRFNNSSGNEQIKFAQERSCISNISLPSYLELIEKEKTFFYDVSHHSSVSELLRSSSRHPKSTSFVYKPTSTPGFRVSKNQRGISRNQSNFHNSNQTYSKHKLISQSDKGYRYLSQSKTTDIDSSKSHETTFDSSENKTLLNTNSVMLNFADNKKNSHFKNIKHSSVHTNGFKRGRRNDKQTSTLLSFADKEQNSHNSMSHPDIVESKSLLNIKSRLSSGYISVNPSSENHVLTSMMTNGMSTSLHGGCMDLYGINRDFFDEDFLDGVMSSKELRCSNASSRQFLNKEYVPMTGFDDKYDIDSKWKVPNVSNDSDVMQRKLRNMFGKLENESESILKKFESERIDRKWENEEQTESVYRFRDSLFDVVSDNDVIHALERNDNMQYESNSNMDVLQQEGEIKRFSKKSFLSDTIDQTLNGAQDLLMNDLNKSKKPSAEFRRDNLSAENVSEFNFFHNYFSPTNVSLLPSFLEGKSYDESITNITDIETTSTDNLSTSGLLELDNPYTDGSRESIIRKFRRSDAIISNAKEVSAHCPICNYINVDGASKLGRLICSSH